MGIHGIDGAIAIVVQSVQLVNRGEDDGPQLRAAGLDCAASGHHQRTEVVVGAVAVVVVERIGIVAVVVVGRCDPGAGLNLERGAVLNEEGIVEHVGRACVQLHVTGGPRTRAIIVDPGFDAVGRTAALTDVKLGLVGSIQHLHLLPDYVKRLEKAGFDVEIPIGGERLTFPGQVLGCNYSGDDPSIGHYLFLGSGDFHPIGLVLHTGKPLAMLDPYTGEATEMSFERIERILRQRFGYIMQIADCKTFGILIGEKPGQMRRNLALRMKRMLESHGKKGYLLAMDHVGPDLIDFYPVDAFVNTACPRIAIDDAVKYAKPLVTPYELEVSLGEKKWEHGYQFDEIP